MQNPFKKKQFKPKQPREQKKEGCKIKIKRDDKGRPIEFRDNGQCSPSQIKNFVENNNIQGIEENE